MPVLVTCELEEQLHRAVSTERIERFTLSDAEAVRVHVSTRRLYQARHANALVLDTTGLDPAEAAEKVIEHIAWCAELAAPSTGEQTVSTETSSP